MIQLPTSKASQNLMGQKMFEILTRAKELESKGRSILHFELGDPDFSTADQIVDTAVESLRRGRTHYEPSQGIAELLNKAADVTLRSRGFRPDLSQLLVTPGANFQIYLALACIADPGDEIIVPDPGFVSYCSVISYLGLKPIRVHVKEQRNFSVCADDIVALVTDRTKAIILNNPSNPTGGITDASEIEKIYEIAAKRGLYVISDEIYARIIYSKDKTFYSISEIDQCRERCILINGFSKAYAMTGWRIGVMTAPAYLTKKMKLLQETLLSCVPGFIQEAAATALDLDEDVWRTMVDEYRQRRDILVEGLNNTKGFTCTLPEGAFYAFPNISGTGFTDKNVAEILLDKCGVAVVPGSYFGMYGKDNIRLSYVCDVDTIREAIKRIQAEFGCA